MCDGSADYGSVEWAVVTGRIAPSVLFVRLEASGEKAFLNITDIHDSNLCSSPESGSRQSRWGWSDVRGCRRVSAGAARPRRDDGRCLIVLDHGGSRRHVIIHHDRPVAPAPEGGSGGGGRPQGPARGAPRPDRGPVPGGGGGPGGVPYAGGDARARRRPGTGRPGALGLEAGRALPSESTIRRVLERVNADDLDARVSSWLRTRVGAIGGRRVIAVDGKTMRGARGPGSGPRICRRPWTRPAAWSWGSGGWPTSPTRYPR